jgi:hypothetical protein
MANTLNSHSGQKDLGAELALPQEPTEQGNCTGNTSNWVKPTLPLVDF